MRDLFELIGETIEGCVRVDSVVGEGGFGVVYRGHHLAFDEPVAIKVLKLPTELPVEQQKVVLKKFRLEAQILYKLCKATLQVVRVISFGALDTRQGEAPYAVLEWLEGESLAEELARRQAAIARGELGAGMPLSAILDRFEPVVRALGHAHKMNVVHRDIKPANIFLCVDHEGKGTTKLLDFGIAKVIDDASAIGASSTLARGTLLALTPEYAAPEQWDRDLGEITPRTDLFSLALMTVELLADRHPIAGSATQRMFAVVNPEKRPTPRQIGLAVPDEVEALFAAALAVDPRERPESVLGWWHDLRRAAGEGREIPPTLIQSGALAGAGGAGAGPTGPRREAIGQAATEPQWQGSATAYAATELPRESRVEPRVEVLTPPAAIAALLAQDAPDVSRASSGSKGLWVVLALVAVFAVGLGGYLLVRPDETQAVRRAIDGQQWSVALAACGRLSSTAKGKVSDLCQRAQREEKARVLFESGRDKAGAGDSRGALEQRSKLPATSVYQARARADALYKAAEEQFKSDARSRVGKLLVHNACADAKKIADDARRVLPAWKALDAQIAVTCSATAAMGPETLAGAHILIAYRGAVRAASKVTRSKEQARAFADKLAGQLRRRPQDFAKLARQYSDDAISARRGGELGSWTRGKMVPAFHRGVAALTVGAVGGPIETLFGYHLLRRDPVRGERAASPQSTGGSGTKAFSPRSGRGYGAGVSRAPRDRRTRVIAGHASVRGSVPKEVVRRIIRQHLGEVRTCYMQGLRRRPGIGGRVLVQFTIGTSGQVVSSKVASSTMGDGDVEACIARALRRWLFPKPRGGGIAIVTYPFVLRQASTPRSLRPEPSPEPTRPPTPAQKSALGSRVVRAYLANQSAKAIQLGKKYLRTFPDDQKILSVVGSAACRIGRRKLARGIYRRLQAGRRKMLAQHCLGAGVRLER